MSVTLLHPRRADQVLLSQWTDLHGYSDTCATVTVLFYLQKSRGGVTRPGGGIRSGEMRAFRFQRNDRLSRPTPAESLRETAGVALDGRQIRVRRCDPDP